MSLLEMVPNELLIEVGECLVDLDNLSFHDLNNFLRCNKHLYHLLTPTLKCFALKNPYLIHWAAVEGHYHLIKLLLDAGVEVDRQTPDHRTALQAAAYGGQLKSMIYLLYRGADVNAHQTWHRTSLHYAVFPLEEEGFKEFVVKALLRYGNCGQIINAQDKDGYTPLHWNAHWGTSAKITQMLLENNANPNIQCRWNKTPLHIAADAGKYSIACQLITSGIDLTITDAFSRTPLHYAARSGHERLVHTLLVSGCPIDVRDFWGKSALHSAAEQGHEHIVAILLAWGAEVDMLDYWNKTPFKMAKGLGWPKVSKMLLWKRRCNIWDMMNED